ncbi:hypothetical protein AQUCO_01000483v1 [Aquilegia coerulea]|uniref:non-specific serine/threonine protein kinase n=1 Tax=Aquilegia coerulea TaxID=218851 RepID=A0A2G5EA53_AQUCA|nr:hypothetical protein AQUCO_01000483v1 [Aquilegia coerulea]
MASDVSKNSSDIGVNSGKTLFSGWKLYITIGISIVCFVIIVLVLLWLYSKRKSERRKMCVKPRLGAILTVPEKMDSRIAFPVNKERIEKVCDSVNTDNVIVINIGSENIDSYTSGNVKSLSASSSLLWHDSQNIGWGQWYALKELEIATNDFSTESVIGEGGYGVVYKGFLLDNSVVAIKNIRNNKGQAEKEFRVEVEAIGRVRHKNLVSLIGYCTEGAKRMLVYEYVDNGNLEQWLHGDHTLISPLTWDIRMKIATGIAKGVAYLHEGLEPKVIHRDIKSSNILLDKKWNAKVSDFGLAKLLRSDESYVTTRVMGTFGCVDPEYASTGMLSESSDVYSFGILLMEIISGRNPVDYARPIGEVNMVDWFKGMVAHRRGEEVVDPLIEVIPSDRALNRALLVCLRCLDLDASKRPKMGQVVHMLEGDNFPFRADNRSPRHTGSLSTRASPIASRIRSPSMTTGVRSFRYVEMESGDKLYG